MIMLSSAVAMYWNKTTRFLIISRESVTSILPVPPLGDSLLGTGRGRGSSQVEAMFDGFVLGGGNA